MKKLIYSIALICFLAAFATACTEENVQPSTDHLKTTGSMTERD
jgi:hypothetical protein